MTELSRRGFLLGAAAVTAAIAGGVVPEPAEQIVTEVAPPVAAWTRAGWMLVQAEIYNGFGYRERPCTLKFTEVYGVHESVRMPRPKLLRIDKDTVLEFFRKVHLETTRFLDGTIWETAWPAPAEVVVRAPWDRVHGLLEVQDLVDFEIDGSLPIPYELRRAR